MAGFNELDKVAKEHGVGQGSGDFMKLEEGDNKVRIVSEYEVLSKYWLGGRSVINVGDDKGVEYPKKDGKGNDVRSSAKFLMYVIDRADGKIKMLESNWTIVSGIRDLSVDEDYAFDEESGLPGYDLKIKKTKTGPNPTDVEYNVLPSPTKTPLTDDEKADVEALTPMSTVVDRFKKKEMERIQAGEFEQYGVKFTGEKKYAGDEEKPADEIDPDDIPFD